MALARRDGRGEIDRHAADGISCAVGALGVVTRDDDERGEVEPSRARIASRGRKPWTKPDSVKPSTSGRHVIQTMAALSRRPV